MSRSTLADGSAPGPGAVEDRPTRHDRRASAEALRRRHRELVVDDPIWVASPTGGAWSWSVRMASGPTFTSRVELDCGEAPAVPPSPGLGRMLAMVDALSYWKAAVPEAVRCGFALPAPPGWWSGVVAGSMAEFLWSNGLDPGWLPGLEAAGESTLELPRAADPSRAVLLHSGGKDSMAAGELLAASGHRLRPLTYQPTPEALAVVAETAPSDGWAGPQGRIIRTLDRKLLDLNAAGYLNGHTPLSAWLALAGLAAAEMTGAGRVAAGNSASDDSPNVAGTFAGQPWPVNHQWSKSAAFEQAWHAVGGAGRDYASPLRPLLELAVLAGMATALPARAARALSCNVAAREGRPGEWCGRCPKCVWTALALGAVVGRGAAAARMGRDPLTVPTNGDLVAAMCGRRGPVPFECAGLPSEVRACIRAVVASEPAGLPALGVLGDEDLDDGLSPPDVAELIGRLGPASLLAPAEVDAAREWTRAARCRLPGGTG